MYEENLKYFLDFAGLFEMHLVEAIIPTKQVEAEPKKNVHVPVCIVSCFPSTHTLFSPCLSS